ncbi:MAG TPA: PQQ-binding-like beta-propeller repeat protein [Candidatus Limnocylindria bacterium]|jgi:outer membrane protein assembly factor BamB|nr:PQQ-binding-like beta-propeller repeat protein [Candidatus Limnocylindria bacterium]
MVRTSRQARALSGTLAAVLVLCTAVSAIRWYLSPNRLSGKSTIDRTLLLARSRLSLPPSAETFALARSRAKDDDWTTFAHDDARTGFQRTQTGITKETVGHLRRRWLRSLNERVWSSPLAADGLLYVATEEGNVYALDAANGEVRWKRNVGTSVHMTPALVDGRLLVGAYGRLGVTGEKPRDAALAALHPGSGALLWRTPLPGLVRSEPVVLHGIIYEGLAGGDAFSGCFQGSVIALDERTGKPTGARWHPTRKADNGGGVWGPLSTDGTRIYVGTGNTCSDLGGAEYGDSVVALSRDLRVLWHLSTRVPGVDDSDVGGGVALHGSRTYVAGKNGYLYALDRATGHVLRRADLAPWARNGGTTATPTGDGTMVIISDGERTDQNDDTKGPGSIVTAFDHEGRALYHFTTAGVVASSAAFIPGIGFLALDRRIVAFDAHTGTQLWSADLGDRAYPSPVVVASGLYVVNDVGDVQAFGLSADEFTAITKR